MTCPHCDSRNVFVGADGNVYCPDCMNTIDGAEFDIHCEGIIEALDDFMEGIDPDDRSRALEAIQAWIDSREEAF